MSLNVVLHFSLLNNFLSLGQRFVEIVACPVFCQDETEASVSLGNFNRNLSFQVYVQKFAKFYNILVLLHTIKIHLIKCDRCLTHHTKLKQLANETISWEERATIKELGKRAGNVLRLIT